nr:hypothetical protein CFP56_00698 [Quercus suber]
MVAMTWPSKKHPGLQSQSGPGGAQGVRTNRPPPPLFCLCDTCTAASLRSLALAQSPRDLTPISSHLCNPLVDDRNLVDHLLP